MVNVLDANERLGEQHLRQWNEVLSNTQFLRATLYHNIMHLAFKLLFCFFIIQNDNTNYSSDYTFVFRKLFIGINELSYVFIDGSDLSCYSCASSKIPELREKTPNASCSSPAKQTCSTKQDRCLRVEVKVNGSEQMMLNCSTQYYCNNLCQLFNVSGGVIGKCQLNATNASCCETNLCNGDSSSTTISTPAKTSLAPCLLRPLAKLLLLLQSCITSWIFPCLFW